MANICVEEALDAATALQWHSSVCAGEANAPVGQAGTGSTR